MRQGAGKPRLRLRKKPRSNSRKTERAITFFEGSICVSVVLKLCMSRNACIVREVASFKLNVASSKPATGICPLGGIVLVLAVALTSEVAGQIPAEQPSPRAKAKPLPLLTTAEQVHRLTRVEAAGAHRAVIRGVVTCSLPESEAVVIQDATRGIYIDRLGLTLGEPPRIGELLEIEGVTDPG